MEAAIMYFNYNNNAYTLNCDWLQYSVMLERKEPDLCCPPRYRLELCQGNNVFQHRALLFDSQGRKVLTLLWCPYSTVLNPLVMTVQLANQFLYCNYIAQSYRLVQTIVPCCFNSVGRFDICCDFTMTNQRMDLVKHLNSGHLYVERKTEGSAFWHEVELEGHKHKQLHCLSWGSKHSEIKVKLYNKTRELGMMNGGKPEKPWIAEEWDIAGIDNQRAWRLEFSLTSNGQLRYKDEPVRLDHIASYSWLARVYFDLYFARFVTRVNQGRKKGHHNNDKRVFLIDLPTDGEKLHWQSLNSRGMESAPAIQLLRSMLRQLNNEALLADKPLFKTYTNTILDVVATHELGDWFENHMGCNAPMFLDGLTATAGEGITFQNVPIDKLID